MEVQIYGCSSLKCCLRSWRFLPAEQLLEPPALLLGPSDPLSPDLPHFGSRQRGHLTAYVLCNISERFAVRESCVIRVGSGDAGGESLLRAQTQSEAAAQMFGADSPAEGRPTPTERGAPSPQKERGGSVGAVTDPGLHTLRIRS
ncbi:hypothetical protein FQA47_022869 [Oryzias melastigma]|uniref:Uncharacterized protein n=1 Tax=Oryzias melastigma TaxID=30732 RepID=A0A834CFB5_ORYME|nr:hypothetical protein FQA47_022869 [Oryzias melastigma]